MNRIDRLFAILVIMQSARRVRAQDLAARFEISVRTVYRDINALSESGIPIVSLPGEGYELLDGFYLPPLVFTEREAAALFLGGRMLMQQATGDLPASIEHALAKLAAVLPQKTREQMNTLTQIIGFITPQDQFDLDDPQILDLQQAIEQRRVVWLRYHSYSGDEITEREVEPAKLYYSEGVWYLQGYCRLRDGMRSFRVSRIQQMRLLSEQFTQRDTETRPAAPTTIYVRFKSEIAPWVRERQHYGFVSEQSDAAHVTMEYRVDQSSEITAWILGWGASAEVLAPVELRQQIREEAQKLAHLLT